MPAARAFLILGLATLLLVAAFLDERLAWAALALDGLVAVAFLVDLRRAARTPLEAARRWPPLLVQEAPAEVEVSAATRAHRPVTVVLREGLHPGLAAGPLRREAVIPGPGEIHWTYGLVPRRRGEHATGPLTARVLGPWGLAWAQRDLLPAEPVRVYPQVRWEGRVGQLLALAQRRRMGQIPQRMHGLGSEPYALREYLPGDPISKIHWKATARHGRPVTREDTWERSARLIVLLDCARAMASMDGRRSKLDYALAATLALTRVAAARGDQVTIIAFAGRVLRSVRVRSGGRGAWAAYEALYDVEAELAEPAYDLAAEAAFGVEPRSATAVLFTRALSAHRPPPDREKREKNRRQDLSFPLSRCGRVGGDGRGVGVRVRAGAAPRPAEKREWIAWFVSVFRRGGDRPLFYDNIARTRPPSSPGRGEGDGRRGPG